MQKQRIVSGTIFLSKKSNVHLLDFKQFSSLRSLA
jgi:hypothetical protein